MRRLRAWVVRLAGMFGSARRDADFSAEIESHLQLHIDDNLHAGLTPAEARRRALVALGGVQQTKERWREWRGIESLDTMWQDVRFAGRVWRKTPSLAAAAVLTLAIGLSATTAVFSFARSFLLRPLPFHNAHELVALWESDRASGYNRIRVSLPNAHDWRQASRTIEDLALFNYAEGNLFDAGEATRVFIGRVSANLFSLLGVPPSLGRGFVGDDERPGALPVAVISTPLWRLRFSGRADILGETIELDGEPTTIVGVMPPEFAFPLNITQVWVPHRVDATSSPRSVRAFQTVARLRGRVSPQQAQRELDDIARRLKAQYPENDGNGVHVEPLRHALNFGHDILQRMSIVLGAAGAFVLLIACANVANLLLFRVLARRPELALRRALGASRARIGRQLFSESLLLASAGGLVALLLTVWTLRALAAAIPDDLYRVGDIALDWTAFLLVAGLSGGAALIVGVAPAMRSNDEDTQRPHREGALRTPVAAPRRRLLRDGLVVVQVALALALVIGASLMFRSVTSLRGTDLGFDPAGVQTMKLMAPEARYDPTRLESLHRALVTDLLQRPGIIGAATVDYLPLNHEAFTVWASTPETGDQERMIASVLTVSPGYFETMGIPVQLGRDFTHQDRDGSPPVAAISEALAARLWPNQDPLGRTLRITTRAGRTSEVTVVGTSGNPSYEVIEGGTLFHIYRPQGQQPSPYFRIVTRSSLPPETAVASARASLRDLDPGLAVSEIRSLQAVVDEFLLPQRMLSSSVMLLAMAALVMALVGVYGVVSYSVTIEQRDTGIRLALGAPPARVLLSTLRRGLALTATGIVLGLAVGILLGRLLASFLFDVTATDGATLAGAALLLAGAALAACLGPARRAVRVDPLTALRSE